VLTANARELDHDASTDSDELVAVSAELEELKEAMVKKIDAVTELERDLEAAHIAITVHDAELKKRDAQRSAGKGKRAESAKLASEAAAQKDAVIADLKMQLLQAKSAADDSMAAAAAAGAADNAAATRGAREVELAEKLAEKLAAAEAQVATLEAENAARVDAMGADVEEAVASATARADTLEESFAVLQVELATAYVPHG
jgi:chromosome segregation ATPase